MSGKNYTFYIASTLSKMRKADACLPTSYTPWRLLALIGTMRCCCRGWLYSRMLWKVGNYNALRSTTRKP